MAIKDAPVVDTIDFDEKKAYNPERPISSLIRTQLLHLHHAEHLVIPEKHRTDVNINTLHTERQASEYIQAVTALLHKYGKKAAKKSSAKASTGSPTTASSIAPPIQRAFASESSKRWTPGPTCFASGAAGFTKPTTFTTSAMSWA